MFGAIVFPKVNVLSQELKGRRRLQVAKVLYLFDYRIWSVPTEFVLETLHLPSVFTRFWEFRPYKYNGGILVSAERV